MYYSIVGRMRKMIDTIYRAEFEKEEKEGIYRMRRGLKASALMPLIPHILTSTKRFDVSIEDPKKSPISPLNFRSHSNALEIEFGSEVGFSKVIQAASSRGRNGNGFCLRSLLICRNPPPPKPTRYQCPTFHLYRLRISKSVACDGQLGKSAGWQRNSVLVQQVCNLSRV